VQIVQVVNFFSTALGEVCGARPQTSKNQCGSGPPVLCLLEKHLEFADFQISTRKLGRPKASAGTIRVTSGIHVYI
jgi:hypothetical protein